MTLINNNDNVPTWAKILGVSSLITGVGVVGALLLAVISLLFWMPLTFLRAWIAVKIWDWFLVPAGAPHETLITFVGVMLVIASFGLYNRKPDTETTEKKNFFNSLCAPYFTALITLFFGFVVHHWFM